MSLYVVATPIGNSDDITLRAIKILQEADIIIGEEQKEVSKLLKKLNINNKRIELLNEHTKNLIDLLHLCKTQYVALVSDCGTPGFCDPGADLISYCRKEDIPVISIPGPSSLMTLLSVSGRKIDQFYFAGFLPAKKEARLQCLKELSKIKISIILMDTPYRLTRLLEDLTPIFGLRQALIGLDLTTDQELIYEGSIIEIKNRFKDFKAEFIMIIFSNQ